MTFLKTEYFKNQLMLQLTNNMFVKLQMETEFLKFIYTIKIGDSDEKKGKIYKTIFLS